MPDATPPKRPSPLLRHPIAIGLAIALGIGVLLVFAAARAAFFLGFVGVLAATVMSFPVDLLSRVLPRSLAALLTVLLLFGLMVGLGFLAVPRVADASQELMQYVSAAAGRLDEWLAEGAGADGADAAGEQPIEATLRHRVDEFLATAMQRALPFTLTVVGSLTGIVLVIALGAFLVARPDAHRRGLRRLLPLSWEPRFDRLWRAEVHGLRHWIGGMIVSMTVTGLLTALGLWLIGIEAWLMLAVFTFFATFVPYLGAVASAIPAMVVGLAQSPTHCLWVLVVYTCVHMTEGYVTQPLVMRRAVQLQPALLLFWQVVMSGAFGLLGVLVSTPLLVALDIFVRIVYVEGYLGRTAPAEA